MPLLFVESMRAAGGSGDYESPALTAELQPQAINYQLVTREIEALNRSELPEYCPNNLCTVRVTGRTLPSHSDTGKHFPPPPYHPGKRASGQCFKLQPGRAKGRCNSNCSALQQTGRS